MEIYLKTSAWTDKPDNTGHYDTNFGKMYFDKELNGWYSKKEHIVDVNCKPVGDVDYWFKPIKLK